MRARRQDGGMHFVVVATQRRHLDGVESVVILCDSFLLDLYQHPMMNHAIDHGGSKGIVVVQQGTPIAEGSIRGDHDGAAFIPVGDNLEEELGPLLVHG